MLSGGFGSSLSCFCWMESTFAKHVLFVRELLKSVFFFLFLLAVKDLGKHMMGTLLLLVP